VASRCSTLIARLTAQRRKNAPRGATLPTEAELNLTAQKYFEQQGPAEQLQNPARAADLQAFKEAFKKGYTAGFKKTHAQR
jgi:flagellar biosynthesis/type III secretory pathway protein FliH